MADICLSYAREDLTRAQQLAEALELRGWSVWWDRRIPHGKDFSAYIQDQLDDARCIVVLWSKTAVQSSFVRDEASEGLNGRLVPLLIESIRPPLGFRQLQSADLTDWSGDHAHEEFARLLDSIGTIVPPQTEPGSFRRVSAQHGRRSPAPADPPGPSAVDVDCWSRQSPLLEVATAFSGATVAHATDGGLDGEPPPRSITLDHSSEFTSRALEHWAYASGVQLDFVRLGTPVENAFIESFNERLWDECLNVDQFTSSEQAKVVIEAWRLDYNWRRPHSSLGHLTPDEFADRRPDQGAGEPASL